MLYLYALIAVFICIAVDNSGHKWPSEKEANIKAGVFLYALLCFIIFNA